jgi:hypothetical protein
MSLYLTEHEISGTLTEEGAHPRELLHQGAQRSGVASGASDVSSIEQVGRLRRPLRNGSFRGPVKPPQAA